MEEDVYHFSSQDLKDRNIETLPPNIGKALEELSKDTVIQRAIEPIFDKYLTLKRQEWREYSIQVYDWERARYLDV